MNNNLHDHPKKLPKLRPITDGSICSRKSGRSRGLLICGSELIALRVWAIISVSSRRGHFYSRSHVLLTSECSYQSRGQQQACLSTSHLRRYNSLREFSPFVEEGARNAFAYSAPGSVGVARLWQTSHLICCRRSSVAYQPVCWLGSLARTALTINKTGLINPNP